MLGEATAPQTIRLEVLLLVTGKYAQLLTYLYCLYGHKQTNKICYWTCSNDSTFADHQWHSRLVKHFNNVSSSQWNPIASMQTPKLNWKKKQEIKKIYNHSLVQPTKQNTIKIEAH